MLLHSHVCQSGSEQFIFRHLLKCFKEAARGMALCEADVAQLNESIGAMSGQGVLPVRVDRWGEAITHVAAEVRELRAAVSELTIRTGLDGIPWPSREFLICLHSSA
jgi:hypothetical protein